MRRQIQHMVKYRYIPFDLGKRKYKKVPTANSPSDEINLQQAK